MKKLLLLGIFAPALLLAQSPSAGLLGVWKADLAQSKFSGPHPNQYLVLIEEKTVILDRRTKESGQEVEELSGVWGEHGEERSLLPFVLNGKPYVRYYQGVPTQIKASRVGNRITLQAQVDGRPALIQRAYELSDGGQKLSIDETITGMGPERHSLIVLQKQPDSAAEPLRKPQELAGVHFKNVKTPELKDLQTSQFIDQMHYFAWSLGKNCEFCHVHDHFDSDDKDEKKTARVMLKMTASINRDTFEGKPEVRCFTCHEFHEHPLSRPLFADEQARRQAEEARERQREGSKPPDPEAKPGEMPPPQPPPQ